MQFHFLVLIQPIPMSYLFCQSLYRPHYYQFHLEELSTSSDSALLSFSNHYNQSTEFEEEQ